MSHLAANVTVYEIGNYTFGVRAETPRKDEKLDVAAATQAKQERAKAKYATQGTRRSVAAVMVVHMHKHAHVLLLRTANGGLQLPGGTLKPGESEIEGLQRKLEAQVKPGYRWEVGDLLSTWYRVDFVTPALYPYLPPHVSKAKECCKVYHVPTPEFLKFIVPRNLKLVAVPLIDVYNDPRYGAIVASTPAMLARYSFVFVRPAAETNAEEAAARIAAAEEAAAKVAAEAAEAAARVAARKAAAAAAAAEETKEPAEETKEPAEEAKEPAEETKESNAPAPAEHPKHDH